MQRLVGPIFFFAAQNSDDAYRASILQSKQSHRPLRKGNGMGMISMTPYAVHHRKNDALGDSS
jgi:hypothetical protein